MIRASLRQPVCKALMVAALAFFPLSGCDLANNHLKIDRSGNKEFQDYRDALAPRLPDVEDTAAVDSAIPDLQPYVADPSDKLKAMPLVSISVNQNIPLRDALFELAEQANYDMELDPNIRGGIIFTARNKPFDVVIDRISDIAGLRYKFEDDILRVEVDTPYHEIYKINYLSYIRNNTSAISNNISVVTGEGADTGSRFESTAESNADFWGEMESNLTQILGAEAASLRTRRDPRITAVADNPAPVEPLTVDDAGEITVPETTQEPPNAVLRVDSLPTDDVEDPNASTAAAPAGEQSTQFSVNRQAGLVSVFATEREHKKVAQYLDLLRKSVTSQVLIEAKVLEVSLTDEFSAGINWETVDLFGGEGFIGFEANSAGFVRGLLDPAVDPDTNFRISQSGSDFAAAVDALNRFGTIHALASPRLTVLNNQSAVLNVATNQVYFEIDIDVTSEEGVVSTEVDSEIRNVPEGVLINVLPSIDLERGTIAMALRPTITRIDSFVNDPGVTFVVAEAELDEAIESPVPVVNVQEMDSVIQVGNGQTIVMGGLLQDRTESTQNGVPVLSELPMLGAAFRNQQDRVSKTELVIFLRATIVDNGDTIHDTDKDLYRGFSQDRRPLDL